MSRSSSSSVSTMDDESDWWKSHDSVSQDQEDGLHDTLPLSNSFFARSVSLSSQSKSPDKL